MVIVTLLQNTNKQIIKVCSATKEAVSFWSLILNAFNKINLNQFLKYVEALILQLQIVPLHVCLPRLTDIL